MESIVIWPGFRSFEGIEYFKVKTFVRLVVGGLLLWRIAFPEIKDIKEVVSRSLYFSLLIIFALFEWLGLIEQCRYGISVENSTLECVHSLD